MKFAVVGTGGVGGYFGGMLEKNGEDVWFLARGKHLEAMRTNGLRINSPDGNWIVPPGKVTDNPEEIGPVDVALFCVKSYDTESASRLMGPLLTDKTVVLSLQNGVDNEEKIQRVIPKGIVFGGVSYIYSTITAPGVITHTPGPTKIIFGEFGKNKVQSSGKIILDVMTKAGISAAYTEDIQPEIWRKYVFIAAVGGMTALTRLTLGEILSVPESKQMLADAMNETHAVALAKQVSLPGNLVDQIFALLKNYDNNSRSSLYHDLIHGKRLEIEAFSGIVVRYGKELGISTPVHRAIYASLLPYNLKHAVS